MTITVRICGDYSVKTKSVSELDNYSIFNKNDFFAILDGGFFKTRPKTSLLKVGDG